MSLVQLLAAPGSRGPCRRVSWPTCAAHVFAPLRGNSSVLTKLLMGSVCGKKFELCWVCRFFFKITSHEYSAANSSGYKTKMYMISLSAKHLLHHLNSQSETLPNQQFFHCFSRESFLETKSHSRINKRWSESSLSRGWFAGQEFKFSGLNEAACSLLENCEAAPVPPRVFPWALGCELPAGMGGQHMAQAPALQSTCCSQGSGLLLI